METVKCKMSDDQFVNAIKELYSQKRTLLAMDADRVAEGVQIAINIIQSLPSADRPQEWIPATWQDENCPERLKRHKCSVYGHRAETVLVRTELVDNYYCNKAEPITEYTHKEQLSKFCPNCGARMKGADDE